MTGTKATEITRRDFLRGTLALTGAALLAKPNLAFSADENVLPADFHGPWGVAFDPDGNLYVSDPGRYGIRVFSPDGRELRRFGKPGSGDGQVNYPTGLSLRDGLLYICDTNNGRIAVTDLEGNHQRHFGSLGITTARLAMPNGVWAGSQWIWVANTRGHVLQRYARQDGRLESAFGRLGDEKAPPEAGSIDYLLRQPTAVAGDDQGKIFLLDSKHARLLALDEEGRFLWESKAVFGGTGLSRPQGLAYTDGVLYLADTGNHRILKLDGEGRAVDELIGVREPYGLAVAGGKLAVAQFKNHAVRLMEIF